MKRFRDFLVVLVTLLTAAGVLEDGVLEDGVLEDGVLEDGVLEDGVLEDGVLEDGVLEDGVLEDGVLEDGVLEDMGTGKWLDVNGEAIYGTRPWYTFGEGPTHIPHKVIESPCTWKDIRYTTKGDYLYVFVLDWPGPNRDVVVGMLARTSDRIGAVESVELLGHDGEIQWKQAPDGLTVRFPQKKPCEFA